MFKLLLTNTFSSVAYFSSFRCGCYQLSCHQCEKGYMKCEEVGNVKGGFFIIPNFWFGLIFNFWLQIPITHFTETSLCLH